MNANKKNPRLRDRLIISLIVLITLFAVSYFFDFENNPLNYLTIAAFTVFLGIIANRVKFLESFTVESESLNLKIKNDRQKVLEFEIPFDKIKEITGDHKSFIFINKYEIKIKYISKEDGAKELFFNVYDEKERTELLHVWQNEISEKIKIL